MRSQFRSLHRLDTNLRANAQPHREHDDQPLAEGVARMLAGKVIRRHDSTRQKIRWNDLLQLDGIVQDEMRTWIENVDWRQRPAFGVVNP
jgi:hypothetical protein